MRDWWLSLVSVEGAKLEFISAGNNEEKSWEQGKRLIHVSREDYTTAPGAWALRQTAKGGARPNEKKGNRHAYLLTREQEKGRNGK